MGMERQPLVSICCAAYNHAGFIRDAMQGFLMQDVDFPIEILVNDDASTDGTASILREYERRHPGIVRVLYQRENQYSRGRSPVRDILYPEARGRYIAICEGDDYWIRPDKLRRQVAYLEANPEYGFSTTDCHEYVEGSGLSREFINRCENDVRPPTEPDALFNSILLYECRLRTATAVVARKHLTSILTGPARQGYAYRLPVGDTLLWLELALITRHHYIDEATAVYRVSPGTVSRPDAAWRRTLFALRGAELRMLYLQYVKDPVVRRRVTERFRRTYLQMLATGVPFETAVDDAAYRSLAFNLGEWILSSELGRRAFGRAWRSRQLASRLRSRLRPSRRPGAQATSCR